ncbi:MAG: crosslink repair DNA glycosylase YcaQ family protein, partial [Candidatus Eisenbacteria bacterium]|nr:crosslink repair DNA glycosylase YcaQ family protein [Candidatus Eisenbacteria bacterium]
MIIETHTLSIRAARRLALARSGFLKSDWTSLPTSVGRGDAAARRAAHQIINRFGYLQLDTVSVAGARSHAIVLGSRLDRFDSRLGEELLQPGEPLFEYWGHEVCWLPMALYADMGWRRKRFRHHPWWGDVIGQHPDLARELLARIRTDGPLKSSDLEGPSGKGWWNHKPAKHVVVALWSSGELAVRERKGFQRTFDLPERVIPAAHREVPEPPLDESLPRLLLLALDGHGWAQTGTLAQSWRLRNMKVEITGALQRLVDSGSIVPCTVGKSAGWIQPADLDLAARLLDVRPTRSGPRLLSPFDP